MKKSILTCALFSTALFLQAQNTNSGTNGQTNGQGVVHWKLNGNQATDDHFMGTVNEKPLILKSNNIEGLRLTPEGKVKMEGLKSLSDSVTLGLPRLAVVYDNGTVGTLEGKQLLDLISLNVDELPHEVNCGTHGGAVPIDADPNYGSYKGSWKSKSGNHTTPAQIYAYTACGPINVGINTKNPQFDLDVNGKSFFNGLTEVREGLIVQHRGGNDKALRIRNSSGINTFIVKENGYVWAREITVTTLNKFPDYVFNNDYKLMPLNELDNFIKTEGHLPNIPTAKEVEENGMSLGELTRLQMEKIEELTLYMIEMKKEVDALKEENETLKTFIKTK